MVFGAPTKKASLEGRGMVQSLFRALLHPKPLGFQECTVDSKKLEHGCRKIYAGFPSFLGFGVGGWSCSNFLASALSNTYFEGSSLNIFPIWGYLDPQDSGQTATASKPT